MADASFKAVQISAKESSGRSSLVEAFNEWAEKEKPSSILHVYYFHDHAVHKRGYLVIFQADVAASRAPQAA